MNREPFSSSHAPIRGPGRGRKRFRADLLDLQGGRFTAHDGKWSIVDVRPGDEEGAFEFDLVQCHSQKKQTLHILVSDTSEYPDNHVLLAYSHDDVDTISEVSRVVERLPKRRACALQGVIDFFLTELSCDTPNGTDDSESIPELDDGESDMEIDDVDNFFEPAPTTTSGLRLDCLKKDFEGTRASGYATSITWTDNDRFILSVSIPVDDLTPRMIPAHALLAWDRHFLEPGQHLMVLISGSLSLYPIIRQDGMLMSEATNIGTIFRFKVGLSQYHKLSKQSAIAAFRNFDLKDKRKINSGLSGTDNKQYTEKEAESSPDVCELTRTSLSNSLESLLDKRLLRLIQLRRKFSLGWAAAEELLWASEAAQDDPVNVLHRKKKVLDAINKEEKRLSVSHDLPPDHIASKSADINIVETAFAFMLRRLAFCTQYCAVCHRKLHNEYEALKPYVCKSNLCIFQYYSLNFGPSLEYEICANTEIVDLLVSLAYIAAAENALTEPFPRGMGLRVLPPNRSVMVDEEGLCDFDDLSKAQMQCCITRLLDTLPSISAMKEYLSENPRATLQQMNPKVLPAAWSLLKWCIASCTSHIQELKNSEDFLGNISGQFRQFRFMSGAPDKEAKFKKALETELKSNPSAQNYPTIFAFHGSPVKNWHSIIRHGLWYKHVANGRSHGNGVYFAMDGNISIAGYAAPTPSRWRSSTLVPSKCFVLAEIVNAPSKFVSTTPYYVVDKVDWIMCRYLLVMSAADDSKEYSVNTTYPPGGVLEQHLEFRACMGSAQVNIPRPSYYLEKILEACHRARLEAQYDRDDGCVFQMPNGVCEAANSVSFVTSSKITAAKWSSDHDWVAKNVENLLPPPEESSIGATIALHKELKGMIQDQQKALKEGGIERLGWHIPLEFNQDNLYQWTVEMHSFDPELPLAKDMKERGVSSLVFEIRFPPSFPMSPPFFRIIRPRFLSFMDGGGGHVTAGKRFHMHGFVNVGGIPSVLLQIRLAISNTDPRPARLHPHNWNRPYTPTEALEGYTRAAALHGWKVLNAAEIRRLVMNH